MTNVRFTIFVLFVFCGHLIVLPQNRSDSNQIDKFARALEDQISCNRKINPIKAIKALKKVGIISGRAYITVDSLNYFRVNRPMKVFGLEVKSIVAFDYDSQLFRRGPGTAPATSIGIVVPFSSDETKKSLPDYLSDDIMIWNANDVRTNSKNRTEIICFRSE